MFLLLLVSDSETSFYLSKCSSSFVALYGDYGGDTITIVVIYG